MLRRCLEVSALLGTFVVLVATSQSRSPCAAETLSARSTGSCGPASDVTFANSQGCGVTSADALDAGLPGSGYIDFGNPTDAGFDFGFSLYGSTEDGGQVSCDAKAADGGFDVQCRTLTASDGGARVTATCDTRLERR